MMRATMRCRGASLLELMTVLAVLSVALAVAAPDLRLLVRAQQLKAASAELLSAIGLARAQGLARGRIVVLAPLDAGGRDWRSGWTVFVDANGDGRPGPGEERILEHGPLAPGMAAVFTFTSTAPPQYIAYNGAGRGCGAANSAQARSGTLSLFHGGAIRRIKINMLGRARLCDPARDSTCDGAAAPPNTPP